MSCSIYPIDRSDTFLLVLDVQLLEIIQTAQLVLFEHEARREYDEIDMQTRIFILLLQDSLPKHLFLQLVPLGKLDLTGHSSPLDLRKVNFV